MLWLDSLGIDGMMKVEFMIEQLAWMMRAKTKLGCLLKGCFGYILVPIGEFISFASSCKFSCDAFLVI